MSLMNNVKRLFTWWGSQTYGTQLFTWRKGQRVGDDAAGNIYYRNADDSRRWVIFKGDAEATQIGPEWHGWLHRTWDDLPTERPLVHKPWEQPHLPNRTGTVDAYAPAGSLRRVTPVTRKDYEAWSPE